MMSDLFVQLGEHLENSIHAKAIDRMVARRLEYQAEALKKFYRTVDSSGDCWLWTGMLFKSGYGKFDFNGVRHYAHRFIYQMVNGDIATNLFVCHHCDTPPCVRPDHLFLGAPKDNTRDMIAKGRSKLRPHLGEMHGRSKLTKLDVLSIRAKYQVGDREGYRLAAKEFGTSPNNIEFVLKRRTWGHV